MNANVQNNNTTTVAPVAHTAPTAQRHYKKSVLEMYTESVEKVIDSKKTAVQVSSSGNQFSGLNAKILNEAKAELGFKSNVWLTAKAMETAGLVNNEDDYGIILFSTKLKEIPNTNRKEKVLNYYRVFNEESLKSVF